MATKGKGVAEFYEGGRWLPVVVGSSLEEGMTLSTGRECEIDLFLRGAGMVVRLKRDTTLLLDRLTFQKGEPGSWPELRLIRGRILGCRDKAADSLFFVVRYVNGLVHSWGCEYDVSANGLIAINSGSALVCPQVPNAIVESITLNQGQSFSPGISPPKDPPPIGPTPHDLAVANGVEFTELRKLLAKAKRNGRVETSEPEKEVPQQVPPNKI